MRPVDSFRDSLESATTRSEVRVRSVRRPECARPPSKLIPRRFRLSSIIHVAIVAAPRVWVKTHSLVCHNRERRKECPMSRWKFWEKPPEEIEPEPAPAQTYRIPPR